MVNKDILHNNPYTFVTRKLACQNSSLHLPLGIPTLTVAAQSGTFTLSFPFFIHNRIFIIKCKVKK